MPTEKASTTLPGKVERVIHAHPASGEPEKAQIAVEGADHLYREIRVPNDLTDAQGQKVKLKVGAEVEVKIEANPVATNVALHDVPAGFRVSPGMPVAADIKVGKRTVLKYLLGQVLPVAQEGMREP